MAKTTAPKGRRVKCQATGVWGTTLTYYKAPDGHWYKDEATYQDKLHKAAMHKQVIAALADVMMFDPSMAFPTIIPKKLKELSFYDDEIILATIEQCRDKIGYAMRTKEFSSEYGRAAYVMAIIKTISTMSIRRQNPTPSYSTSRKQKSSRSPFCKISILG